MTNADIKFSWNGKTLNKAFINTSVGDVPLLSFLPNNSTSQNVIFAIHYQEGSKEIWLEEESFSSILNFAIINEIPFYAIDLYGHGAWKSEDSNFNPEYLDDDQWEKFVRLSVTGINEVILKLLNNKSINIVSSSTGCLMAVKTIAKGINLNTLIMASPVPAKSYDDEYSLHNNIESLKDCKLLVLTGENDEEVEAGEVKWYFDQIESNQKEIVIYNSGHELPKEWSDKAIQFMKDS